MTNEEMMNELRKEAVQSRRLFFLGMFASLLTPIVFIAMLVLAPNYLDHALSDSSIATRLPEIQIAALIFSAFVVTIFFFEDRGLAQDREALRAEMSRLDQVLSYSPGFIEAWKEADASSLQDHDMPAQAGQSYGPAKEESQPAEAESRAVAEAWGTERLLGKGENAA